MEGTPNQVVRVALSILNIENVWGRMEAGCSVITPRRHFNLREASIYSVHKPVAYTPEGAHRNLTSGGTGIYCMYLKHGCILMQITGIEPNF